MDPANVLVVPDERRGRAHLRRQRHLAGESPRRSARGFAARRELWNHSMGRFDESARFAPGWPWQKAAGGISVAKFPATPGVGGICRIYLVEVRREPVDLVSRRQSGPGR